MLQDAGYHTGMIGKWGLSESDTDILPSMPNQQGFDFFYGYRGHADAHYHYWDKMYRNNEVEIIEGNEPLTNSGEYNQDRFTREAITWLGERSSNKDQPFFLYLPWALPHLAVTVPDDSKLAYKDLGWPERPMEIQGNYINDAEGNVAYAGMVSRIDDHVGLIIQELEKLGLSDNTLVIFTSDNGHEYDDGFFNSNGPLRGKKRDLFEGGIRIPFIARWPGEIQAGMTNSHVSSFQDFLATACDLADVASCPESDGLSMVPAMTGTGEQQQHEFLYWEFNEKAGPTQAVRAGDWKLVKRYKKPLTLFNLENDIGESNNLAKEYPEQLDRLVSMLEGARTKHPEFTLQKILNNIKRILKTMFRHLARNFFRQKDQNIDSPSYWIDKYLPNRYFNIVQVGSNDGCTGDPIFHLVKKKTKWRIVFIEPVPFLFEKLKQNYGSENRFIFENVAINDGSSQVFYSVKENVKEFISDLPSWHDQLSSFDKENILKHLDGILEPYIEETVVNGLTLKEVFSRNKVNSLGLLHVDAEGYDWKVLNQIRLEKFKPIIILFEHKHLKDSEKKEALFYLATNYHIVQFGDDFLCISKNKTKKKDLNRLKDRIVNVC